MKTQCGWLAAILVLLACSVAAARTWTDAQGNTIEAKFVRVHQGNVVLLKGNKPVSVPLSRLSAEDQEYVKQQLDEKSSKTGPALVPVDTPKAEEPKGEEAADVRTWTDIAGNQTKATFVEYAAGRVVLMVNGNRRHYPFTGFCAADKEYIRKELEARGQGHLLPGSVRPPTDHMAGTPPGMVRPPTGPTQPSFPRHTNPRPPQSPTPSIPRPTALPTIPSTRPPTSPPRPSYQPPRPTMPSPAPTRPTVPSYNPPPSPPSPPMPEPQVQFQYEKRCSNCNKVVPESSKAGGICPHCKVRWDYEDGPGGRKTSPAGTVRMYGALGALGAFLIGLLYRFLSR